MKNLKAMSKRSLALFLAFIMCVSMMQLSVFAAEPEDTTDTSVSETTDVSTDTETDADTDVDNTDVDNTDVEDTDVEDTDVEDTDVEDTDVEDTDVDDTDVEDTDVEDTDVEDTDVEDTDVEDTDVEDTDVEDTDVEDTDVEDTDVEDTDVDDTDVEDTDVEDTDVEDTDVEDTDVDDTNVDNTGVNTPDAGSANPPATDTPVVDTPAVEPPVVNTPPAVEPPAVSTPPAPKAPAVEEVPAEVRAFLKAVAKIPGDINVDNAEKVAELVYGEVSEAYEALLGTEYEDRADVQKAVEAYAAAIEAVEEALELASETFYTESMGKQYDKYLHDTFYYNRQPEAYLYLGIHPNNIKEDWTNPAEGLTVFVGEEGGTQRLYTHSHSCSYGHILHEETPEWIAVEPNKSDYFVNSNPTIVKDITWGLDGYVEEDASDAGYGGFPALTIGFTGNKPGITKLNFYVWQEYYYQYGWNYCSSCWQRVNVNFNGWVRDTELLNVTVNARYQLNYDSQGGSAVAPTYRDVANTTAILTPSGTPTKQNYTFLGWAERPNATADEVISSATLNWEEGVDGAGNLNGSTANPVSKTLYAVWEETGNNQDTTYTIVREYYIDDAKIAMVTVRDQSGTVGQEIVGQTLADAHATGNTPSDNWTLRKVEGETLEFTYEGSYAGSYNDKGELTVGSKADSVTLTADTNTNVIVLRYEKNTGTPTKTYTVVYTDGVETEEVFVDQRTPNLSEGDATPAFAEADKGTETMTGTDGKSVVQPKRDGYTFMGWSPAVKTTVDPDMADANGEIVYTATWQENTVTPTTYTVTYSWSGLPEDADDLPTPPAGGSYTEGTEVEVDTQFGNGDTTSVGGKTYVFSGWTVPSDVTVTGGKFDMPAKDVAITGTWTEQQYTVKYEWTVPDGVTLPEDVTLPTGGSYTQGTEVTVDGEYTSTTEVTIGDKTYAFSGWSTGDATIEGDKFTMPGNNVTITGQWTEKTETPPIIPPVVTYNVTYRWTGLPEGAAALPAGGSYAVGAWVTVNASFSEGTTVTVNGTTYEFSGWDRGSFAMPAADVVIRGSWTAVRTTYTVAHEYYTDGTLDTRNESTYTGEVGSAVDPAAIDRIPNGYRFTSVNPGTVQTLTENGNLTITLRYDRTTGGGGGGGGGGGTDDPDPTPDPDPAPNPDQPTPDVPVADIPEPDVPLVETPEEDVPLGEIPEENVPLTEFPETPVEEEIPDPEVPLADVPRTGDGLGLWLALSLGSALALLCAVFRRKKEED